jgi:predicted outer membrane protein
MRRTLFRWAFSLAMLGAVCAGASHQGLAAPKKAPPWAAGEPNEARATNESNLSDAQILGVANAATDGEIALSSLASSKAQSEPVRQLALMIMKDDGAAKEQGRKLAARLRIKPAPCSLGNALQKQTDDALGRLEKGDALEFDRIYVESQVRLLQRVLQVLDELLPQTEAKELRALLTDMRAKAEHHLEVARGTLANH